MIACDCISAQSTNLSDPDFSLFEELGQNCKALRNLLIPNEHWTDYKNFCLSKPDEAHHRPIMWLAYRGGCLCNFTKPIHTFFLEGKPPTKLITSQYREDLKEQWFLKNNHNERYETSRIFQGRLAELRFASWLQQSGWQISNLEAYRGEFDVEAINPSGAKIFFEIKYLALEENRYNLGVKALNSNGVSSEALDCYSPSDYLLCRTYEAAHKLRGAFSSRIAVIVLADYSVFRLPLKDGWIKWNEPSLSNRGQDIQPFLIKP